MNFRRLRVGGLIIGLVVLSGSVSVFGQAWKADIGFNDLVAEKGGTLEDGTGLTVGHVEAGTNYLPDSLNSQFSGKNIMDLSGLSSGVSGHATGVGTRIYGNTGSMTGGITEISAYSAGDYLFRVLGLQSGGDPMAQGFDVTNHSYIGSGDNAAEEIDILQRFDFVINRDDMIAVVGTNNGSTRSTPRLLAPSYNAITVGRTDGNHARGETPVYGLGRFKPDIVAPQSSSSNATPLVGSAAALLKSAGAGTNAVHNEVIKSMLFAGATKNEFPDWDRTTARPIDEVFGFGELNILNSYHIFEGGEFDASTSEPTTDSGLIGWDFESFDGIGDRFYDFELLEARSDLSAALVWNIDVTDTDPNAGVFNAVTSLANLDLELFDSSGSFLGSLVDASLSTDYNLEHIYFEDLAAGNYTFRISGDIPVDYGFSWQFSAVPEPSGLMLAGLFVAGLGARRRRRS